MAEAQDLHAWLDSYSESHRDDVVVVDEPVADEDVAALVWELARDGRHPLLRFPAMIGADTEVVTNLFASRARIERMLSAPPGELHRTYQQRAARRCPVRVVDSGPVTASVHSGADVDLSTLPLLRHFETDRAPYITSGIIVADDPETGVGNLSYHHAMVSSRRTLATSLHSRGDLFRMLAAAGRVGRALPVALVIGGHPLFMLAASARVPPSVDEREIAGGLFGAPLDVVRTPRYGIGVPATSDVVLEGVIHPGVSAPEGPFGEFSGYSSDRSTNNVIEVETVLSRHDPVWLDVVGGNSAEHLNLARVPREAEMSERLMERFPNVQALAYPNSGTHFHAYVAVKPGRPGEARQVMLALLGWDPYLKTVVAVDDDVDVTDDGAVLWALATHFQAGEDVMIIDRLPGSPLDPSSSPTGGTSRMGLDATRSAGFSGVRIGISIAAQDQAAKLARAYLGTSVDHRP